MDSRTHDDALREAFDGQAARFARSPVQNDPAALGRLLAFASVAPGGHVLDAGCGPGIVAETFLAAGCRVTGVDLSREMISRARARNARFGDRAQFELRHLDALPRDAVFDAAVSRFVLHHVEDPQAFLSAQVARVRRGGVVVACDHAGDPDPAAARWHQDIEAARDRSHVRNLTPGEVCDAFARAGLAAISLAEDPLDLDFDEWFDRGTPRAPKEEVRGRLLAGRARGFDPVPGPDGRVAIHAVRVFVRGVKP